MGHYFNGLVYGEIRLLYRWKPVRVFPLISSVVHFMGGKHARQSSRLDEQAGHRG